MLDYILTLCVFALFGTKFPLICRKLKVAPHFTTESLHKSIINSPQGKEQYKRLQPVQGITQNKKITTKTIIKHNITHYTSNTTVHKSNTKIEYNNHLESTTKMFKCSRFNNWGLS